MNNTLLFISTIFPLIILYLLCYFSQNMSIKKNFYGININNDQIDNIKFKNIDKRYKNLLTIGCVISIILYFILTYVIKNKEDISLIIILGFVFYHTILYIDTNKKVKLIKYELNENKEVENQRSNIKINTTFINEKNNLIRKFSVIQLIFMSFVFITAMYVFSRYDDILNMIPIQWDMNGNPSTLIEKSFLNTIGLFMILISVPIIIFISSINSLKTRNTFLSNDEEDMSQHIKYLSKIANVFLCISITTNIILILGMIGMIYPSIMNKYIMWMIMIITILNIVYLMIIWYKVPIQVNNKHSIEDEDSLWIWGMFYNNKNDPVTFVPKRFGVGWSINIGHTKGKLVLLIPIIIFIITMFII